MSLKVLIVDDSKSIRGVIKKTLTAAGFPVDELWEAANGKEALDLILENPVGVVLSDLHMPEMDGLELLRTLNQMGQVPPCFILVTTEGRKEQLREAVSLGARGYVTKPFKPEALRKILSLFVGEPDESELDDGTEGLDF
jgi:two-component system chemotaxis response regulator CheY